MAWLDPHFWSPAVRQIGAPPEPWSCAHVGHFIVKLLFPASLGSDQFFWGRWEGCWRSIGLRGDYGVEHFVWALLRAIRLLCGWQWWVDTSPVLRTAVVGAWLIFSATALVVLWARHRSAEDTPLPQPEAGYRSVRLSPTCQELRLPGGVAVVGGDRGEALAPAPHNGLN